MVQKHNPVGRIDQGILETFGRMQDADLLAQGQ